MDHLARAAARARPLPAGLKIGYSAGAVVDGIIPQTTGLFLMFYVTAVCGLPGALAGFALAAGMVADAVLDPAIGSISDIWRSRLGRRVPFMLLGLPLATLSFVGIFSLPAGLSTLGLFACFLVLSILLRVSGSIFNLPFNALLAEVTEDAGERGSIASLRFFFSMAGTMVALVLGFGIFFKGEGGLTQRAAYAPFAIAAAVPLVLSGLVAIWASLRLRNRAHSPSIVEGQLHTRLLAELREAFGNPSFRVLLATAILFFTALGSHSALALHVNTYFWRLAPGQIQLVTLSTFLGLMLGAPIAGPVLKRIEKKTAVMIGICGLAGAGCGPAGLRLLGALPVAGPQLGIILAVVQGLGGVLMAIAAVALLAMIADAADEHEHRFGGRREGLYAAGWSFASKAAAGLGSLLAGVVLQLAHVPSIASHGSGGASTASIRVAPEVMTQLVLFYSIGAGLIYLGAFLAVRSYRLTAARHRTIIADLADRRQGLAEVAANAPLDSP